MRKTHTHNIPRKKLTKLFPLLKLLTRLSSEERKALVGYINQEGCNAICQCIHNSITNQDIASQNRRNLKQKTAGVKETLRYLSNASKPVHLRQKKLSQIGGNPLGIILATVLPILANFLFSKKK
jgi:hypothetical protein